MVEILTLQKTPLSLLFPNLICIVYEINIPYLKTLSSKINQKDQKFIELFPILALQFSSAIPKNHLLISFIGSKEPQSFVVPCKYKKHRKTFIINEEMSLAISQRYRF